MNIYFTQVSANSKTGNVPTGWVGLTEEATRASCAGCALLDPLPGRKAPRCYAWSGAVRFGAMSAQKVAVRAPETRTLAAAIAAAARSARMLRLTGLGDIGRAGVAAADSIAAQSKAAGLALVGYTHHWREPAVSEAWRGRLMASTETLSDADTASAAGWAVTVVVADDTPRVSTTPAGRAVVICPAQVAEARKKAAKAAAVALADEAAQALALAAAERIAVTCNACRLCVGSVPGRIVGFWEHGNGAE